MSKRYFMKETAKPGQISEELRVALGISKRSLPVWIHRMRILGYPPGWLRKADMTNTTINFIDGETDAEQGQMEDVQKTYNTDSFFEYPGFNAPVPKGVKDDYEKLGMPPMQQFQQLNYAKQTVQSIQPVPFRRSTAELKDKLADQSDSDSGASDDEKNETIDLDSAVEKDEQEKEESEDDSDDSAIIVLDVEKRSLCSKLKKASDLKKDQEAGKTTENFVPEQSAAEAGQESKEPLDKESSKEKCIEEQATEEQATEEKPVEEQNKNGQQPETEDCEKPEDSENAAADDTEDAGCTDADAVKGRESTSSRITLVSLGAPVPAALNGEKPPLENFGVGMGPMIHFENLPNSTGVFDKMRKVIKKIRKKLS